MMSWGKGYEQQNKLFGHHEESADKAVAGRRKDCVLDSNDALLSLLLLYIEKQNKT